MMKLTAAALALPLLLTGMSASASSLNCSGSYFIYQIQVSAKVKGASVVGPGKVTVSGAGQSGKSILIGIDSGSFVAQSSLAFTGTSKDGQSRGSINSVYAAAGGTYNGTAAVTSPRGNFTTQVTCRLN